MYLTREEVEEREETLRKIKIELDQTLQEQRIAKEFGDLSENTEYEASTQRVITLRLKEHEIEEELLGYELVETDKGPRFTIGSYVSVQKLDDKGLPDGEEREFLLSNAGTTRDADVVHLLNELNNKEESVKKKQRLGVNSTLGQAILNGTSGVYTIQTVNGSITYKVTKVIK